MSDIIIAELFITQQINKNNIIKQTILKDLNINKKIENDEMKIKQSIEFECVER